MYKLQERGESPSPAYVSIKIFSDIYYLSDITYKTF